MPLYGLRGGKVGAGAFGVGVSGTAAADAAGIIGVAGVVAAFVERPAEKVPGVTDADRRDGAGVAVPTGKGLLVPVSAAAAT